MPQRLSQLRGQAAQIRALQRMLTSARTVHALLLVGPEGVGKTTLAHALSASLCCLSPQQGDACGACRSCHALDRGNHPDIDVLARDGQGIKIDAVRESTRRLRFDPVLGQAKVLIVEEADRLREEAANALLKALEEPARRTHYLLVSSRPQLLLDTIRSRCQTLRLGPLGDDDLHAILVHEGHDATTARIAAALADGSLAQARLRADARWQPVIEHIVAFGVALGAHPIGAEVAFVERLGELLADAPLPQAPSEPESDAVVPTASLAEARAAGRDGGAKPAARAAPAERSAAKGRSKNLDRDGLAAALDLLRALLRDALLVAAGVDAMTLPHARWAEGVRALAARGGDHGIAEALSRSKAVDDKLVYNPGTSLLLEALLVELGAAIRHA